MKKTLEYAHKKEYEDELDSHDDYIKDFDAYEAMLMGYVYDSVSKSIQKASITDSYATTLAIERAARVVGKLPDGLTEPAFRKDSGKAMFMDILRQKWIYPNANSQRLFFEKIRLWQLYSSVYGYMPMFYDWNVSLNGYVGPDCWLWNPRNLIPEAGKASLEDMYHVTAISYVSPSTIEGWIDADESAGWDKGALKEVLSIAEQNVVDNDDKRDTQATQKRVPNQSRKGIMVATRFEAGEEGRWVSFCPDQSFLQIRDIKNPHKNGRIPFVIKYSQPLFDSFYGMGDFQRAKPLQFARDGLTNFYFQGIKMNLLPPIIANANGVLKHTLNYAANTIMFETQPNSIRRMETSTAGLATYQAAQSQLTGSLLSLYGTQNASIPGAEALNPSQGKTPAAINRFQDLEATRDGQDRTFLEGAIEKLTDGFNSLIANIGTETIPINLLMEDVDSIAKAGHKDILELVVPAEDDMSGTMMIDQEQLRNSEFRFNITPGSTAAENKRQQMEDMQLIMGNLAKFQNILKEDPRVNIEWGKMVAAFNSLTSIKNVDEFVSIKSDEQLQAEQEQMMAQQAQMNAEAMMQKQQEQAELAPAATNVRGMTFRNPQIAEVASMIDQQ